jgi:hypothetical protein
LAAAFRWPRSDLIEEDSMNTARRLVAVATLATIAALPLNAQNAQTSASTVKGFGVGHTDIGPVVGLGGLGAASFAIGGRFERGLRALPDLGNGVLGLGISADWYNYNERFLNSDYDFTYIPIAATGNYHFNVKNKKYDPFVGLGLGYLIVNTPYSGSYDSGIYFVGRLGMRYFMSDKMALYGDVGAGAAALNVGLTFSLSGS